MRGDLDALRAEREMRWAIVRVAGRRPQTTAAAAGATDRGASAGPAGAPVDATVGFLLNIDSLNVGRLRS